MEHVTAFFGNNLKTLREAAGLNQAELAEKLGVSRGAISYYENGDRTPDIAFLDKIQRLFDVPCDFLMGYTSNMITDFPYGEEAFGLSDKALSLMEMDNTIGHMVSSILEHESFDRLSGLIERVLIDEYVNDPSLCADDQKPLDPDDIDFISFLITNTLQLIISDVLKHVYYSKIYKNVTEEDIRKKLDSLEKKLDEYNIADKAEENKILNNFENQKKKSSDSEFALRKKVHAAFGDPNYPRSKK